mmetsp:Transcript_934/g.1448  ORF Transcript_934/g.1448 Transcript_934/m.1448 type:complete len:90 (+) Transcript_934:264-533(+)
MVQDVIERAFKIRAVIRIGWIGRITAPLSTSIVLVVHASKVAAQRSHLALVPLLIMDLIGNLVEPAEAFGAIGAIVGDLGRDLPPRGLL